MKPAATDPVSHRGEPAGWPLKVLRCPVTRSKLVRAGDELVAVAFPEHRYRIGPHGIPLFAEQACSREARVQEAHYEKIAMAYVDNLHYPHTQEYMTYLDQALLGLVEDRSLETVAEICCGRGEVMHLLGDRVGRGIGIDISVAMLKLAAQEPRGKAFRFIQGDATMLPLADDSFDSVFMLGGVHHVNDRERLFDEIARILKPGGRFYFREPVSDFPPWRWLRSAIYRWSPALDHKTERPLRRCETLPLLARAGLRTSHWSTHGFLGFCLLMNSDVLVFNRIFRFLPGIRAITRGATQLDRMTLRFPGLAGAGLQVVGVAEKLVKPL